MPTPMLKEKSASGTTSLVAEEKVGKVDGLGLQAKEICRIIKVCQKSRVLSLELGAIRISFQGANSRSVSKEASEIAETKSIPLAGEVSAHADVEVPRSLLTPADKDALEEAQIAQLMIDDPSAYEKLMIDDHLQRPSRKSVNEQAEDRRPQ